MDPKNAGVLLSIPEFKGMSSNPPRGTVLAPALLENVHLDRTGGYSPMYDVATQYGLVTRAVSAGKGDDLFIQTGSPGDVRYFDVFGGFAGVIDGATSLSGAALIMPGVLLTPDGWLTSAGVQPNSLTPGTVGNTGTPDVTWAYVDQSASSGPPRFAAGVEYRLVIEWVPTKTKPYRGTTVIDVGAGHGSPPSYFWISLTAGDSADPPRFNVYVGNVGTAQTFVGSNFVAGSQGVPYTVDTVTVKGLDPAANTGEFITGTTMQFGTTFLATAYHQGRAYIAPSSVVYDRVNEDPKDAASAAVTRMDEPTPTRLFFSEITADGTKALPAFSALNYVDVTFKVSRRIVALCSAGPYLYIFGDRELLILTGDPSSDARIESIGDSIGAVSAGSVQQLSGTVFWLSDSGVMAAQGAQVREVGADVRDLIGSLRTGYPITSTTDFKRETYLLTDGALTLCYHAREGGWTVRGVSPTELIGGGGTPYAIQNGDLVSLGGETPGGAPAPPRLTMRIEWPHYELGSWLARKTFRGVACGLDLDGLAATVTHLSVVDSDVVSDTTLTVLPGHTGVRLHTARDGIPMTGVGLSVRLTVSTQDSRGILRPPLTVHGNANGEEAWTDGR